MINEAFPSMPVEILGMNSSAFAGAEFLVTPNEEEAKEISKIKSNDTEKNKSIAKDKINFEFRDDMSPGVFKVNSEGNSKISFLCVIMPIRTD